MAISIHATSVWGEAQISSPGISIPGTPAAGDRIVAWASWKDFAITATAALDGSGSMTEVTEFADGSVVAGNGTGSMKVACWYKDWVSGDTVVNFTLSSAPSIVSYVVQVLRKDSSETWDTPTFATAAISAATTWSATASSTIDITSGAIVMELVGIRDDSATFTRNADTSLDDDGSPAVTWNGNVVENPATHKTTTTGLDMAADLIHRFVTTGASAVRLTATGTLSASETGAVLWVHQSVTAAAVERVPKYQPMVQLLAH